MHILEKRKNVVSDAWDVRMAGLVVETAAVVAAIVDVTTIQMLHKKILIWTIEVG